MDNLPTTNQNPGDLVYAGQEGASQSGRFAKFSSPQEGYGALLNDIQAKTNAHPDWTLADFSNVYAPNSDGNNSAQYAAKLANQLGVSPATTLSQLQPNIGKLAQAISVNEGYQGAQAPEPVSGGSTQPAASTQPTGESQGLLSKLEGEAGNAIQGVSNATTKTLTSQINPISGLIQGVGSIAGGITGGINDVATSIPVVGGVIKGAESLVGGALQGAANTAPGQAIAGFLQKQAQQHPELAGDITGAANIAGLAGLIGGGGELLSAGKEAVAGALGKDVTLSKALDIVAPKETAAYLKNAVKQGRTASSGLLGNISAGADADTIGAAKALTEKAPISGTEPIIAKLRRSSNVAQKANIMRNAINTEADALESTLRQLPIQPILTDEDLSSLRSQMEKSAQDSFTLTGNTSAYADKAINKFFSLLPQEGDISAADLLKARKGLDTWAKLQKGGKIFDPAAANAQSEALRVVRQAVNKAVADKAPDVAVKQSLDWQSRMYDGLENVANAGYKEVGTSRLGRFAARHPITTGLIKNLGRGTVVGTGISAAENVF